MAISSNIISLSFLASLAIVWVYRGLLFGFVSKKVHSVRETINSAQRQRLESLMHLKQIRARTSVMSNESNKAIEKATEEANKIKLKAEQLAKDFIAKNAEQATKIALSKSSAIAYQHRKLALDVAVDVVSHLLHENSRKLNDAKHARNMLTNIE